MAEIKSIIEALAPIIAPIITSLGVITAARIRMEYRHPKLKPSQIEKKEYKTLKKTSPQKSLVQKPWFICLASLLCMAYVLPEVLTAEELDRMAVYKITIGVTVFLYVLIQSSISKLVDTIGLLMT